MSNEVIVTSDASGQLFNTCVWDQNGSVLRTYKGGVSALRTLSTLNGDYLITAQKDKPLIQVWLLNRQEPMNLRMVCPGVVRALAVCPNGSFCVGAIAEQLYVWRVTDGKLITTLKRHYQTVTNVRFTDNGQAFISTGEDGLVLAWLLSNVVSEKRENRSEPWYTWSHHSLSVTDLHVGKGGLHARVATVSLDQTCRIYSLSSGQLLANIVANVGLGSLAMDLSEQWLLLGGLNGRIIQVNLQAPPRSLDFHLDKKSSAVFAGHTGAVKCLAVASQGSLLLSGSQDGSVKLWHIGSRQCIRTLPHRGPVTNAFFSTHYAMMREEGEKPRSLIASFQRQREETGVPSTVEVMNKVEQSGLNTVLGVGDHGVEESRHQGVKVSEQRNWQDEVAFLKEQNHQLYQFAVKHLLDK